MLNELCKEVKKIFFSMNFIIGFFSWAIYLLLNYNCYKIVIIIDQIVSAAAICLLCFLTIEKQLATKKCFIYLFKTLLSMWIIITLFIATFDRMWLVTNIVLIILFITIKICVNRIYLHK